jgi:glycosyltransferase involved in cell wall biosynthesis/SAM-dependent methyltransferase
VAQEIPAVILIPAYRPAAALVSLVGELAADADCRIVVVDDGSGPEFEPVFAKLDGVPNVSVVRHCANLGKGAALKTGLNYAMARYPSACGVVTADADGQHHPDDIRAVATRLRQNPRKLVLGARRFDGDVPLRSRIGNGTTRMLMRLLVGQKLADTQTGLRGIPAFLVPHLLRLPSTGYEFELDMLLACKHQSCDIVEEPIRTIYLEGNKSSHFRPVADSMRIYFLLFRFSLLALLTAALDNLVFAGAFALTGSIGRSQLAGRAVAMVFNYLGARRAVFHSKQRHAAVLPKYVLVVALNGLISYALIQWLHTRFGAPAMAAKLAAEGLLFLINFAIQRDFVFTRRRESPAATDWDEYYTSVPATAKLTRRYTTSVLLDALRRHATASSDRKLSIVEIGGANSCFLHEILHHIPCRSYDVIDTNRYGLSLLEQKTAGLPVGLHCESVLDLRMQAEADVVFSVGLVEHFDPRLTREAILAHFRLLRPGGTAIITFPTPTLLYRVARRLIEAIGKWKFHDERPLMPAEVIATVSERADVLERKTMWPLILTQHVVVAQKRGGGLATDAAVGREAQSFTPPQDFLSEKAGHPDREAEEVAERNQPPIRAHAGVAQHGAAHYDARHESRG